MEEEYCFYGSGAKTSKHLQLISIVRGIEAMHMMKKGQVH